MSATTALGRAPQSAQLPALGGAGWDAARLDADRSWLLGSVPVHAGAATDAELPALTGRIRALLRSGPGIALVKDRFAALDDAQLLAVHDRIAGRLGEQVDGTDPAESLGGASNGRALPLHTDGADIDAIPDAVGIVCLASGSEGHHPVLSSGIRAYRRLAEDEPGVLADLSQPFARAAADPGTEDPDEVLVVDRDRFAVFSIDARGDLTVRYARSTIERERRESGAHLAPESIRALDRLDAVLAEPGALLRVPLGRGDLLWVDNRRVLHGGTAGSGVAPTLRSTALRWPRRGT